MDILFVSSSPLKAKGDSKDTVDVEPSPLATSPVTSAPPASVEPKVSAGGSSGLPGLDVSKQEVESDEDGSGHIDIVGSPGGDAEDRDLVVAEEILSLRKAPSSSCGSLSSSSSSGDSRKRHPP